MVFAHAENASSERSSAIAALLIRPPASSGHYERIYFRTAGNIQPSWYLVHEAAAGFAIASTGYARRTGKCHSS
jgi:hypothetical protein